ncbi:sugar transferase [Nitrospina watsonii]|uniref:Undecaprenyl-phosphate galactosephosphotransferase n=1 Tax=Nitrospina watsonii TaxID=1323948 RepID=A0ABM9HA65_9BACT|nr:sugar transferase [Nitrospina watsonii]CAI2717020.1 Undecaprenyl-phosphate galactosephosphotransferase [Nitrospina watsonii]
MFLKRIFDLTASLFALAFLWPLFLAVAVAIRLDSPGGVFYYQERVGKGGWPFHMIKFRSMVADADKVGSYWTAFGDARITRVGAFLRKTSLDEVPQLWNVVKGEMSLVGPRPNVPAQRANYTEEQWAKRTSVLPGITGLAQARVRSLAKPGERLALDLEYVDRASFWLDIKIILLTIRQVILQKGVS